MTWSRFDDGYDEHDKVEEAWDAERATIGLHVQATTACNRWLSDGVIKPRWLKAKLPDTKERARVLAAMVEFGLFELLAAGQRRVLVDGDGNEIAVGAFREDRYVVHDFLERHDSSVQTKARRRVDAERKRAGRRKDKPESPADVQLDANGTLPRLVGDSPGSPLTGGGAGAPPRPDPALPDPTPPSPPSVAAREHTRAVEITDTLSSIADRRSIPRPSVAEIEAALVDHADRDPGKALAALKEWAAKKRINNMAGAFRHELSKAPLLPPAARPVAVSAASDGDAEQWDTTVSKLRERVAESAYVQWLEPLRLAGVNGEGLVLTAPDLIRDWVCSHYAMFIAETLGRPVHIIARAEEAAA